MVVGATFLPGTLTASECFASTVILPLPFIFTAENLRLERIAVIGGIHGFPALVSDSYGGEGKTASLNLRNQAGEL